MKKVKLQELLDYNPITIQCHDNPDADAIAAGYGLYCYFQSKGKDVKIIYSGNFAINKSNLLLMLEKLNIPIEYREDTSKPLEGLLITVDCQYGCGNVKKFQAPTVAVIDHHQVEIEENSLCEIRSNLGSCSTLVWKLLLDEGYPVNDDVALGTALYYGLFTDTNQFAELHNPLDMDMREDVSVNRSLITFFRNSNISIAELETAGLALIRNIYNDKYRYAIIKAHPCDPNILGLISDFLLQVAGVDTCVVYNELPNGFKMSVRSCIKEVHANELASYLCEDMGSGGGHLEKAGGFISRVKYEAKYMGIHSEAYFGEKLNDYFESTTVINAATTDLDISQMKKYQKNNLPIGCVKATDVYPVGTEIMIRTLEGDVNLEITEDLIIMIGIKGEVYPSTMEKFNRSYKIIDDSYDITKSVVPTEYVPMIKDVKAGRTCQITEYAKTCIPTGKVQIWAKPIDNTIKVFTAWDDETYMLGKPGDYLAVRSDDLHDIYVVEHKIFHITYSPIESK